MQAAKNFFFTYGDSETQPFHDGWTVVAADSYEKAVAAFKLYHPPVTDNILPCSWIYSSEEFDRTVMKEQGNFGAYAHELIVLQKIEIKN